jgi:hypothetical protein
MRKVLRGYAKGQDGNLILIGTIPVPHSKDKRSPRERQDKRHLVRQGARSLKRKLFVSLSMPAPPSGSKPLGG